MESKLMSFFDHDNHGMSLLQKIFRGKINPVVRDRLKEIFTVTEKYWDENVERMGEVTVKYLLICEAPPWTEPGDNPKYFYIYTQDTSPLLTVVHKTFFEGSDDSHQTYLEKLDDLAKAGVLLIDSLPYSMRYSTQQRRSKSYLDLIKFSVNEYMLSKLHSSGLSLDPTIRLSFGFNINGQRIVEAFPEGLRIRQDGERIPISVDMISTSRAGFLPHKVKLRQVFELK